MYLRAAAGTIRWKRQLIFRCCVGGTVGKDVLRSLTNNRDLWKWWRGLFQVEVSVLEGRNSFPLCPWDGILDNQGAFYLWEALLLSTDPSWIKGLWLSICAEPLLSRLLSPCNLALPEPGTGLPSNLKLCNSFIGMPEYEAFTPAEAALPICSLHGFISNNCINLESSCHEITPVSSYVAAVSKPVLSKKWHRLETLRAAWASLKGWIPIDFSRVSVRSITVCSVQSMTGFAVLNLLYWSSKYFLPLVILKGFSGTVISDVQCGVVGSTARCLCRTRILVHLAGSN